jgi:nucleoside-diphosphate kinase
MKACSVYVEWYDPQPMLVREYLLRIYFEECEVEMYDVKSRRTFLKLSPLPASIKRDDLYLGNEIVLHSRSLRIIRYADLATEKVLTEALIGSTCILTHNCLKYGELGNAISVIEEVGLKIIKLKMVALTDIEAGECSSLLCKGSQMVALLRLSKCIAVTVLGADALEALKQACNKINESSGRGRMDNFAVAAPDSFAAKTLDEFAFGHSRPLSHWPTAQYGPHSTCCIIRPHALVSNTLGAILAHIEAPSIYEISAMAFFRLDIPSASEFLEIYEGVVPGFGASVKQLSSGPCCALEVRAADAVTKFRETAGPWDVNFAREIQPKTIRAIFGLDGVKNAVHCTDLAEDSERELRYLFDMMSPC